VGYLLLEAAVLLRIPRSRQVLEMPALLRPRLAAFTFGH
jgi:hypothetical protein